MVTSNQLDLFSQAANTAEAAGKELSCYRAVQDHGTHLPSPYPQSITYKTIPSNRLLKQIAIQSTVVTRIYDKIQ